MLTSPDELAAELERHHLDSYGWALSCCDGETADAEDVLQSVYVKVLEGRARFEGRSSFRTWLFGVIRRTAAEQRRRTWLRRIGLRRALARGERPGARARSSSDPAADLDSSERRLRLRRALGALPPRQRQVLHLVFYQGLTVAEAAGVLRVSVGTARTHYERGKSNLRRALETSDRP